jgi:hypothetical protein
MKRVSWAFAILVGAACDKGDESQGGTGGAAAPSASVAEAPPAGDSGARIQPSATAAVVFGPAPFPALQARDQAELMTLVPLEAAWLAKYLDVEGPGHTNQGNPEIAHHEISRDACRKGLLGVVIQTPAQQARCGGHENMVPVEGDKTSFCIDVFEFPNRACELPFVWVGPTVARTLCERLGKRLCTQQEWVRACAGDPAGGEDWRYAYGSELDLTRCNTNKRAAALNKRPCDARTIYAAWDSCGSHTEPSGAFPGCRSRYGVYDLHGNVAEEMTRWDVKDGRTVSQLKGSAFFYVDVHRKDGGERKRENYPDHCAHDPRWHVEPMSRAWHVNYHLGFRCCLGLDDAKN